jgi:FkbM family methyltransferase
MASGQCSQEECLANTGGWRDLILSLQKLRENYYLSKLLRVVSRPLYLGATFLSSQIAQKVKSNGIAVSLPNGQTLRVARNCGINIASALYWHGLDGYEAATSKTLRFFFERVTGFVDIGANYGLYSLLAALWNPQIVVTAFEPEPRIHRCLKTNVRINGLASRIHVEKLALSDKCGKAAFYLPPSQSKDIESTGTIAEGSWQSRNEHSTLEVDMVSFDDFEAQHPMRLELVKIDVEDAEARVLAGMAKTIRRDQPIIVCEILPRAHKNERTLGIIQDLGYTAYWITSVGYIRVSNFDFERRTSQDFLLSAHHAGRDIVTDAGAFLA